MRMAIDWDNLTFKGKDVLLGIVFVGGLTFNYASNNEKLNTIIDNQTENKVLFKELGIRQSKIEIEISDIKTEQRLLKQRVDAFQNTNSLR